MKRAIWMAMVAAVAAATALGEPVPYAGQTEEGEYTIGTLEQLRTFEAAAHVTSFQGSTFTLLADIDCGGGRFNTGAPDHPSTFAGTFDGRGHTISNFVHVPTGSTQEGYGVAMFDFAETGAAILNLTLEGTLPGTASGAYAAPFVLAVESPLGLFMDNCHFRGSVTNYYHAAGLVGFASSGTGAGEVSSVTLTNCSVRGEIVSTWVYTAGGLVAKGTGVQAFDCSVESELHGGRTGGLVGEAYGGSFEGCSFEGTMRPDRETVGNCIQGGLAAEASNAVFLACTSAVGFDSRAAAAGGAAGVTHGSSAFHDCSATVEAAVPTGRFGGFVGWTAGAETFSNCTATMTVDAIPVIDPETHQTNIYSLATGGFAGSVASDGALFVDCTASARGNDLKGGFYYNQQPYSTNSAVGSNAFLRCHVVDSTAKAAGFCMNAWNCAFEGCTVRGGTGGAGFVQRAGGQPDKQYNSDYSYEQTSTFTDCSVHGTRASSGFVMSANSGNKNGHTNVFRRCRAGCIYGNSNNSGAVAVGFGSTLNKGTLVEDCAAYGIADMAHLEAGFAGSIGVGATVRRSVGAVYPRTTDTQGAGFADLIAYGTTVENCYAVYAPYANAVEPYSDQAYKYGVQGGFVRRTSIGTNEGDLPIVRCFALWPLSEPVSGKWISGSFCGVTPNSTSTNYFEDCYRPAEAAIGSCHNEDAAGVTAFTKAEFAGATAATMPNYDFADTWHAPGGVASSPYLDASVDENGDFWFLAGIVGAEGQVLVNGEAPREAYPAGSVLTVQAVADNPDMPFAGWVGDGFADPSAQTTTYTVKNVSAIAAKFAIPIYTVDDWTNRAHATYISSDTTAYALMNDLDFTDYIASNGWNYVDGYYAFAGKLFGQGHTIRGLVTTNGSFTTTMALFSSIANGAEIRDLTIEFSNVPGDQNTLSLAGLAASVGSGCLISNCHVKADWQGVYPDVYVSPAYKSCQYYGLAQTVSGVGIRIVDCTVEGKLAGGTEACGFVGSATLNGGEIARCAVFADVSTITNRTNGDACGFAGSLDLTNAVVRECFAAGTVDAARSANGFAGSILFRDSASSIRDCYSTMEVATRGSRHNYCYANGIADTISGDYSDSGAKVENVWFGGTVRGGYQQYAFARGVDYATVENGRWLAVDGGAAQGTEGVTEIAVADRLKAASWEGYDLGGVWRMEEGKTTPYFAWSLRDGKFAALPEKKPGTLIEVPGGNPLPGTDAAVSASTTTDELMFCSWAGAAEYADAGSAETTYLADNHRAPRCVWGHAITNAEGLLNMTNDLEGIYVLGADIDLQTTEWTPVGRDDYEPFTGGFYGNGHVISNLNYIHGDDDYAGLFGCLDGATVEGVRLVGPVVEGRSHVGSLAGRARNSTVRDCFVENGIVQATGDRAGVFMGQVDSGTAVLRCGALGEVEAAGYYVGGFVGVLDGENGGCTVGQCFAGGSVACTNGHAGGFAGWAGGRPAAVSDCYAVASVRGSDRVGGFVGHAQYGSTSFERCYAAGGETRGGGSNVGGFAGYQQNSSGLPVFADCVRPDDGLMDVGGADHEGIAAFSAAAMLNPANFEAFHATGFWTQQKGKTQPYFDWSLKDGKMQLLATSTDWLAGEPIGGGWFAPGTQADLDVHVVDGVFLAWIGNAGYADAASAKTTVLVDNFRTATARCGRLVTTREELEAIADAPDQSYGLGTDIDLGGADWTPLGNNAAPFSGALYGRGYAITGLRIDTGSDYAGLFGVVSNAVFDGVALDGASVNAYRYSGALAGDVRGASLFKDCTVQGSLTNSNAYAGLLAGRIYGTGTRLVDCAAFGTVAGAGDNIGGLAGAVYYAPASFAGCAADVDVESAGGSCKGGFVGAVRDGDARASFENCAASGTVRATNSAQVGGFIGYAYKPVSAKGCVAEGDVFGKGTTGGFVGQASGTGSAFEGCRADGFASGAGYVGGFAGQINAASTFSKCAARGDVRSAGSGFGGFVGYLGHSEALVTDSWSSGAVWGTGGKAGAFVGNYYRGTNENCGVYGAANGLRPFCGSSSEVWGGTLSSAEVKNLSKGWPKVRKRADSAIEISTAEELLDVTNDLAGVYVLAADIDLGGAAWTPIGNSSKPFTGEFYGKNHHIRNFTVAATAQYAGLFGHINGGRVSGVLAQGRVDGGSQNCVAGFAGRIAGQSLVEGCLFEGSVSGTGQYLGGFAGQTADQPVIVRCQAVADVVRTNGSSYTGGFVAYHGDGFISDCFFLGGERGVDGGSGQYVGGFAGYLATTSARIGTSYSSASVASASGRYLGAFLGGRYGDAAVDGLYYRSDLNEGLLAVGTYGNGSEAHEAIVPLAGGDMVHRASFPTFDFAETWINDEGLTLPELQAFFAQKSGYETWAEANGVTGGPTDETNGIANAIRYAFGIDPAIGPDEAPSLLSVAGGMPGDPGFAVSPLANEDGVEVGVLATDDIRDWTGDHLIPLVFRADGLWRPAEGYDPAKLFGRLAVAVDPEP